MGKVLILFSHPNLEKSWANTRLLNYIKDKKGVTFHDLYEEYPNFNVDIEREKSLLLEHDIIIWHHPIFWYSCPALMKQWIDLVLEFQWAYGPNGNALKGKRCFNVVTTGSARSVYGKNGPHKYTLQTFLRPFEQTATLCGMNYLPPFAIMGVHRLSEEALKVYAEKYVKLLDLLIDDQLIAIEDNCVFFNDIIELNT